MNDFTNKHFPEGMTPIDDAPFHFACHPGVPCFTRCCRKLELFLYPYDIIRLKKRLGISSEEFLNTYTGVVQGGNPCFPSVIMRMRDDAENSCPFLDPTAGCTVYEDRPSACRTYPLERAVDRNPERGAAREYYFMTNHDYCLGHHESREWTVKEWLRDQQLLYYNAMDDLWAEMDTLFAANPWQGEGAGGPKQLVAFMVCYNIDRFRQYVGDHNLLDQYKLDKARRRAIQSDDEALLTFGFDWLKLILTGRPTLQTKR
ncbi:MAG: YkgJ family cysteine cluster protein [Thermodesulfobacteriota bacterium]